MSDSKSFDAIARQAAMQVRNALAQADIGSFYFAVEFHGRTHGDCDSGKVTYKVGLDNWGSNRVEGDSLEACLTEFLRQHGWRNRHAPLALTYDATNDEAAA